MPTVLQFRRGTEAQNNSFTGAAGEISIDTENATLRVHDGSTAGGSTIATEAYVDNAVGSLSADSISNGTSTLTVIASGGNIRANVGGSQIALVTSSGIDITGTITATTFSGSGASLTNLNGANISSGTIPDARIGSSSVIQHQGNITAVGTLLSLTTSGDAVIGGNLTVNGTTTTINSTTLTVDDKTVVVARGAADGAAADGAGISVDGASATLTYANTGDKWVSNKSFDVGTNSLLLGGITNNNADGVGNIGASGSTFNTVFAKATSAQYADLAEKYTADAEYAPGTVLVIGGTHEVTACKKYADASAAGVVSTNPAHLMNSGLDAENTVDLALTGRVPCRVVGSINKGDLLTTSEIEGVATRLLPDSFIPGCVIGKALEEYTGTDIGVIEILVGKV